MFVKEKHAQLQDLAIRWLYGIGCSIYAKEVPSKNGVADAIGVKTRNGKGDVYYLECKASRSDLICLKQKAVYARATGQQDDWCWAHNPEIYRSLFKDKGIDRTVGWQDCETCKRLKAAIADTAIDFYYLVIADGVKVEDTLYPAFGVIDEHGTILRRAKRMKRSDRDNTETIVSIAHVLVYKVFGKLYLGEPIPATTIE